MNNKIYTIFFTILMTFSCLRVNAEETTAVSKELEVAEMYRNTLKRYKYAIIVCAYNYYESKLQLPDPKYDFYYDCTIIKVIKGDLKIGQLITTECMGEKSALEINSPYKPGSLYFVFSDGLEYRNGKRTLLFLDTACMPIYSKELAKMLDIESLESSGK